MEWRRPREGDLVRSGTLNTVRCLTIYSVEEGYDSQKPQQKGNQPFRQYCTYPIPDATVSNMDLEILATNLVVSCSSAGELNASDETWESGGWDKQHTLTRVLHGTSAHPVPQKGDIIVFGNRGDTLRVAVYSMQTQQELFSYDVPELDRTIEASDYLVMNLLVTLIPGVSIGGHAEPTKAPEFVQGFTRFDCFIITLDEETEQLLEASEEPPGDDDEDVTP